MKRLLLGLILLNAVFCLEIEAAAACENGQTCSAALASDQPTSLDTYCDLVYGSGTERSIPGSCHGITANNPVGCCDCPPAAPPFQMFHNCN